jgi:predicted nucleotidyltransferase
MVKIFLLLKKKNTSEVLRYFLEHPTGKVYAGEMEKRVPLSKVSLLAGLRTLAEAGVLQSEEIGRVIRYSLVRDNSAVRQLKILLTLDKILPLLEKLKGTGIEAYLYGSCARGEDTEESDVDLLLIGNLGRTEVLGKLGKLEKLTPIYFTFLEYSSLARKDKAFYERVEKDRIRLM